MSLIHETFKVDLVHAYGWMVSGWCLINRTAITLGRRSDSPIPLHRSPMAKYDRHILIA